MKGLNLMKLSCAEAASVCTKAEYQEAGLFEKWRLRLHLYFCRTCKDYYQNNKKLTGLIKKADIRQCSSHEKEVLRTKIKNGNSKTS
ncbi:hypothetical protein ACXYMT_14970 [Salinimicrobium sp. CAU 1759]